MAINVDMKLFGMVLVGKMIDKRLMVDMSLFGMVLVGSLMTDM